MRGLAALLRADMCWQHREIAEAAVIQLYIALDASFQMVLRLLREQGMPNPTAAFGLWPAHHKPKSEIGAPIVKIALSVPRILLACSF